MLKPINPRLTPTGRVRGCGAIDPLRCERHDVRPHSTHYSIRLEATRMEMLCGRDLSVRILGAVCPRSRGLSLWEAVESSVDCTHTAGHN